MDFAKSRLYGVSNKKYLSELLQLELKTLKDVDSNYEVEPFLKKLMEKLENYITHQMLTKEHLKILLRD
ncbi:MAG: hypothetical protein ACLS8G_14990 [Enterococcus faecalis]